MPANPYTRMGLIRLSPNTGKELTRLNVMQGQILHGKVFKMENFGQGQGQTATGSPLTSGGIAKIALGAHLIEAIVSQPLPEGSSVKLEVIKLADESFTLKLMAIDGEAVGRSEPAKVSQDVDQAQWSRHVRDMLAMDDFPQARETGMRSLNQTGARAVDVARLVQLPEFSSLPKPVMNLIRAAVNEGFIEPSSFSVNGETVRSAILNTVTSAESQITNMQTSQTGAVKELADSFSTIAKMLKPILDMLPSGKIEFTQTQESIAPAIRNTSQALRAFIPVITGQQVTATSAGTPSAQAATQAQPGPDFSTPQPGAGSQAFSEGADPQAQSGKPAVPSPQDILPAQTSAKTQQVQGPVIKPLDGQLPAELQSTTTPLKPGQMPASAKQDAGNFDTAKIPAEISETASRSGSERADSARSMLFALRTLSNLSERMATVKGLAVEESATYANHSSRLTNVSNALEGAIVSPLLTQLIDSPDLIPRLLLTLLFPGGTAELGIFQQVSGDENLHGGAHNENGDAGSDRAPTVGVIRLKTEGLGNVGVRLEYSEDEENNPGRLSGRFNAVEGPAGELRDGLPSLESALDARGIGSGGFTVMELSANGIPARSTEPESNSENGLDIKA